ncbi:PWWP domain-containing DNA repair factor 3A [Fundulus heteroclitus]|uniref:PWWP domain-containing DNA repair factor 3A n=1 Tax=Fundulus heteroclitus TaxID=8078 RepID=UPI00165ADC26|nr:PWWP domain-containing DNA repair factor 3A [Fundulus heteroclitus]
MRGRPRKSKKTPVFKQIHSPVADVSISDDLPTFKLSTLESVSTTPERRKGPRRRTQISNQTSTPVHGSSTSNIILSSSGADEEQLEYTECITNAKTPEADSSCHKSKSQKRSHTSPPRQLTRGKKQTQSNGTVTKRPRGRPRKNKPVDVNGKGPAPPSKRIRPKFELQKPDPADQDESLLSSDLSIELSHFEEQLPSLAMLEDESEDEEEEEEEELPSYLMKKNIKPPSITEGAFVWGKCRNYPYWPALVKNVNRKQKKASIMFVDQAFTGIHNKKGFTLPLKSLKPFDCEEADELMQKAKESYEAAVTWALDFIEDYRIRIACGSFSGSFIEYCNHDMSYPVRRMYPQAAADTVMITCDTTTEEPCEDQKEDREDASTSSKRLLPDRTQAAHNRANEKLVHFIVKLRMVEKHLLAVIQGQQQSRWLRSFLSPKRKRVVNIYLEDDQQLDQVYWYLNDVYGKAATKSPCLAKLTSMERVPFVLDVLLPEAIIYAIAGVDNVSVKKAEEKYLEGRCISNRERQAFDLMIERQMRRKSLRQNTALELLSDSVN